MDLTKILENADWDLYETWSRPEIDLSQTKRKVKSAQDNLSSGQTDRWTDKVTYWFPNRAKKRPGDPLEEITNHLTKCLLKNYYDCVWTRGHGDVCVETATNITQSWVISLVRRSPLTDFNLKNSRNYQIIDDFCLVVSHFRFSTHSWRSEKFLSPVFRPGNLDIF